MENSNALNVVVIEDDESLLRLYEINFRQAQFPIAFNGFKSSIDAINHMFVTSADLVVVDMELPDMNGYELIDSLFAFFGMYGTKVMVISGKEEVDIRSHGNLPSGVSVFSKPVPFDYLLDKLKLMYDFKIGLA